MSKDNKRNILGDNTSDNKYDSSSVASNANGSIIERIEYLQGLVSAFTSGEVLLKGVVDTAVASTTNVKCDTLKGFGEDFFNNVFYIQVVRSGGAAPEPEVRKITNYVTATGTFTVDAFSDTVASGDLIYIMHESVVILGRDDADNVYDSSNVAANATGSIIERIHYIQGLLDTEVAAILAAVDTEVAAIKTETDKIAATIVKIDGEVVKTTAIQSDIGDPSARTNFKSIEAMLGMVDAANSCLDDMLRTGFDSSAITNDEDGSIMERLEGLKDRMSTIAGYIDTEVAAILAATDTEVAAIKTETDKIAGEVVKTAAIQSSIGTLSNTGGTATLGGILGDVKNISVAESLMDGYKKTTIADGTTIPNNSQAAAGLLATATGGDIFVEEIIWQRGADNFVGPTNYEFSTDNVDGLTGAAAPNGVAILAKFNAATTGILSIDGTTKQLPFVLESTKKLYIHGDDAATSAGGTTNFYIKYKRLSAGAYLA
jgi:hypothetical protein